MHDTNARQRWLDNEGSGGMVGDRLSAADIRDISAAYVQVIIKLTALYLHSVEANQKQAENAAQLMAETLHDLVQDATGPQLRKIEDGDE